MINIVLVPADLDVPLSKAEMEVGDLKAMQAIVGGYIEFTDLDQVGDSFVSNEEGLLIGLPVNVRATALLHLWSPRHIGRTILVGDCFLIGQPDEGGDSTSVSSKTLKILEEYIPS